MLYLEICIGLRFIKKIKGTYYINLYPKYYLLLSKKYNTTNITNILPRFNKSVEILFKLKKRSKFAKYYIILSII